MKRILITGIAGFIGANLCRKLLAEGNEIIGLDNLCSGSYKNIEEFVGYKCFEMHIGDVRNEYDFGKVDEIYNLACPASPPHYQRNPFFTTTTSIYGVINALNIAKKYDARILQASTSEIYGDPLVSPQPETYWGNVNPIGIRSCYDEGKRCAETLMADHHRQFNTKTKLIRVFNTYGEFMDAKDGRVVSNFITQALTDNDITIYGDGTQTRSFQYISDLLDGIENVMASSDDNVGPFNIGNPCEFTIAELAELVIRMTSSKSKIIFLPLPQDDPKRRKPDITKMQTTFGWGPKVELEEGLKRTIEYFKSIKHNQLQCSK